MRFDEALLAKKTWSHKYANRILVDWLVDLGKKELRKVREKEEEREICRSYKEIQVYRLRLNLQLKKQICLIY